jgi:DNA-binding MarR family transcriptional regulator
VSAEEYACAQAWAALSAAHAKVAGLLASALAGSCGISVNEFEMLLRLDRAAGRRLRLGELNAAVPLTQPALSRAVTRLADRGWLERAGAPDDGRGVLILLTAAGEAALRAAVPVHARVIRAALLDRMSAAEQDMLAEVLRRVAAPEAGPSAAALTAGVTAREP